MTSRTINRQLVIHNDLAIGVGAVSQERGFNTTVEQQLELDFIFRTLDEIRTLDHSKYTRVSLHTMGPLTHYYFDVGSAAVDNNDTVLAPIPPVSTGRWLRVQRDTGLSLTYGIIDDMVQDIDVVPTLEPYTRAVVSGYHNPGDEGGGAFYWDNLSIDPDDHGLTFTPNGHVGAGRWKRITPNMISVHQFGAVGNGTTNDADAVKNAMLAASTYNLTLSFRDLTYDVPGLNVTLPNAVRFVGQSTPLLLNGDKITVTSNFISIINLTLVDWTNGIDLIPTESMFCNFDGFGAVRCPYGVQSLQTAESIATLRIRGGYFEGSSTVRPFYFAGKVIVADISGVKIEHIGNTSNNTTGIALGVDTLDCETIIIRNCEMSYLTAGDNAACNAIVVAGDKIVLTNNIIHNILGTGQGKEAISLIVSNCVIANNSITNGGLDGRGWITCEYSGSANDVVIANNILIGDTGVAGQGIYLNGTGTIIGNRITGDFLTLGIKVLGQTIANQVIVNDNYIDCPAATSGMSLADITNSTISNNHVLAQDYAIKAELPANTYDINGGIFSGNYLKAGRGISLNNSINVRFEGNIYNTSIDEIEGSYQGNWWFIDGVMSTTSTALLGLTNIVNTMPYKRLGLMVWDETLNAPLYAAGADAADSWLDSVGTTVHIPV